MILLWWQVLLMETLLIFQTPDAFIALKQIWLITQCPGFSSLPQPDGCKQKSAQSLAFADLYFTRVMEEWACLSLCLLTILMCFSLFWSCASTVAVILFTRCYWLRCGSYVSGSKKIYKQNENSRNLSVLLMFNWPAEIMYTIWRINLMMVSVLKAHPRESKAPLPP